mgnify:CR=1 FL=1
MRRRRSSRQVARRGQRLEPPAPVRAGGLDQAARPDDPGAAVGQLQSELDDYVAEHEGRHSKPVDQASMAAGDVEFF